MKLLKKFLRWSLGVLGVLILLLVGGYWLFLYASADVGAGYAAKRIASGVFVAGRSPESIANEELGFLPILNYEVDWEGRTVTAWLFEKEKCTAVYRDGLGVALALDGDVEALQEQARPDLWSVPQDLRQEPWPVGDAPSEDPRPEGIDEAALTAAIDDMFEEPRPFYLRRTRAVVIVYKGEIIGERYAEGYDKNQRFPAWSVTKSITHALYGIAVRDGILSVEDRAPVGLWQEAGDRRKDITIDMLLRMSSGIQYNEFDVTPPADLTTMLFLNPGAGAYAETLPLAYEPDTHWAYASATSNILSQILRQTINDDDRYYAMPYEELFRPLGMVSAYLEADATGTFVGSSYFFATARDFARFGMLYAHNGVWEGKRVLPAGWTDYATTPTPAAKEGQYGAHWWKPWADERAAAEAQGVTLPPDTMHASGFEGQKIVVIPSRDLVIVRLGLQYFSNYPFYDHVVDVLKALPPQTAAAG
jgi:CubicO group peptidase (beta-lactamase class C family)